MDEVKTNWSSSKTLPKKIKIEDPDHWKNPREEVERGKVMECDCYRCERRRLEKEKMVTKAVNFSNNIFVNEG